MRARVRARASGAAGGGGAAAAGAQAGGQRARAGAGGATSKEHITLHPIISYRMSHYIISCCHHATEYDERAAKAHALGRAARHWGRSAGGLRRLRPPCQWTAVTAAAAADLPQCDTHPVLKPKPGSRSAGVSFGFWHEVSVSSIPASVLGCWFCMDIHVGFGY